MKTFITFCKKEFIENIRTFKLIVMLAAFILLGISNPLFAKMIPDILNGTEMNGIIITMPEPTVMDSWAQFFSNNAQLGVLVLVIVFCGITSNDISRGTLVNILTKGMKRSTVVLSKFTVASIIWTACYLISFAVTYAYNIYFWGNEALPHALIAFAGPWGYGILLISLMVFGGIWFKNFYGSLILTGGAIVILSVFNIVPKVQKYNPMSLAGDTLNLLSGQKSPGDFIPALAICAAAVVLFIIGSCIMFDRKQL